MSWISSWKLTLWELETKRDEASDLRYFLEGDTLLLLIFPLLQLFQPFKILLSYYSSHLVTTYSEDSLFQLVYLRFLISLVKPEGKKTQRIHLSNNHHLFHNDHHRFHHLYKRVHYFIRLCNLLLCNSQSHDITTPPTSTTITVTKSSFKSARNHLLLLLLLSKPQSICCLNHLVLSVLIIYFTRPCLLRRQLVGIISNKYKFGFVTCAVLTSIADFNGTLFQYLYLYDILTRNNEYESCQDETKSSQVDFPRIRMR